MSTLKQSAVSGVKWTTMATLVIASLQVVQLTVLARLLKPVDFGLMGMAMVVIGFAQTYADMGISAAIVHRQTVSREQLSSLYWLNILAGIIIFALVWAAAPLAVLLFHEPLLYRLLPVVAISFLISSLGLQFHWLLEKELKFETLAKQEITSAVAGAFIAIISAFWGHGVWSLVWGQLSAALIKSSLLLSIGWSQWPPLLHFRRSDLHGFLGFGLYQMGERSINYFNSRIDQLLIGSLLGAQELGYYNFAFNLVTQPVNNINPIITRVAFPVFAQMQDDSVALRNSYLKMVGLLSTVNAPLLFGLAAIAPLVIPLLFGSQWVPAILLVQVLAFYAFVRSTSNPIGSLLLSKGRADLGFRWNLALLFTTAPVVYLGAKLGDALGIAVILVLMMICYAIANYVFLVKKLIGSCGRPYMSSILRPVVLSAAMAAAVWFTSLMVGRSITWLALEIGGGGLLYLSLLWFYDRKMIFEVKEMLIGTR